MEAIYKITNKINGKIYIGKTKRGVNVRWREHIWYAQNQSVLNLHKAIRKYGHENFQVELIEETTNDIVAEREQHWINQLDTVNPSKGYNMTSGGEGVNDLSQESRKKISDAITGIKRSEETRLKISQAQTGKPRSEETKRKLSAYWKGRPRGTYSEDRINKMKIGMDIRNQIYTKPIEVIEEFRRKRPGSNRTDIRVRYKCLGCFSVKETDKYKLKTPTFCQHCCKHKIK